MSNQTIDRHVLRMLRNTLIVQILILLISSFTPSLYSIFEGTRPNFNLIYLIPISITILIFILLSIKSIQKKITKRYFLAILLIIAIITVFTRQISINKGAKNTGLLNQLPKNRGYRSEWDSIFFLIIPLGFIAWQYSIKEVTVFCVIIIVAENLTLLFQNNKNDLLYIITNIFSDITRSCILFIAGWIENSLVAVQRKQQQQIESANKILRRFALTKERLGQTQERNRLARELHDTLAHTLSSIAVQLEALETILDRDKEDAKKLLKDISKNTITGLKETRRTLVDLRSSELESYGLTQVILNIGESASERGGFSIEYNLANGANILADDVSHCLYRTVQEAIENILRHANAKNVLLSVFLDDSTVKLIIKDDGIGFDINTISENNLGIRGMRERVEMLGGKFNLESNPENIGTTVIVEMEIDYD